ncbi:MAG: formyltetrahydrofolate deformylase [Bdellovibrionota bacterium]
MSKHVLLIQCRDEMGLVHKVTGALLKRNLNVVENAETVDTVTTSFFMRTEFLGDISSDELLDELKSLLPRNAEVHLRLQNPKKLLILATRESHCLGDLLLRHHSGELNAKILGVVSQYDSLSDLAERFSIPYKHVPVDPSLDRAAHEEKLLQCCNEFEADYLILAKYMRVLSSDFTQRFPERMINIHHSFLPAFVGASPYKQAYERGVKIIGATAHFVTQELDEGPIITQSVIPVKNSESPAQMAKAGREIEKLVLARAINLVLEDRVMVHGRRTIVFE